MVNMMWFILFAEVQVETEDGDSSNGTWEAEEIAIEEISHWLVVVRPITEGLVAPDKEGR